MYVYVCMCIDISYMYEIELSVYICACMNNYVCVSTRCVYVVCMYVFVFVFVTVFVCMWLYCMCLYVCVCIYVLSRHIISCYMSYHMYQMRTGFSFSPETDFCGFFGSIDGKLSRAIVIPEPQKVIEKKRKIFILSLSVDFLSLQPIRLPWWYSIWEMR